MKLLLVLFLAAVALAADTPPTIDAILATEELQTKYFACLVDKGPCTPGATAFKQVLADALTTDCASCTPEQKVNANKVINFAKDNKPELFTAVEQKYDPEGKFRARSAA